MKSALIRVTSDREHSDLIWGFIWVRNAILLILACMEKQLFKNVTQQSPQQPNLFCRYHALSKHLSRSRVCFLSLNLISIYFAWLAFISLAKAIVA